MHIHRVATALCRFQLAKAASITGSHRWRFDCFFRHKRDEGTSNGLMIRVVRQVGPFVGINVDVIQFFIPVGVADVTPTLCPQRHVAWIKDCDHCAVGSLRRLAQQWDKRSSIESIRSRHAAQLCQCCTDQPDLLRAHIENRLSRSHLHASSVVLQ